MPPDPSDRRAATASDAAPTGAGVRLCQWLAGAALLAAGATPAGAQVRPFTFTVTTTVPTGEREWAAFCDAGYGERTSEPFGLDGLEQGIGVQGPLGAGFTLLGRVGLGTGPAGEALSSQEAELLKDVLPSSSAFRLALGLGARREWQGETVALARVSVGRATARSLLFGNVRIERPFAEARDSLDLITTLGWLLRAGDSLRVGIEAVGEDLEGLWEEEEAEGGARIYVGPALHWSRPHGRLWASLGGGPVVRASRSERRSPAPRPVGAVDGGYTVRLSLGFTF